MYEVVLLAERPLAEADARMIADVYGEVANTTHLHVLMPVQHDADGAPTTGEPSAPRGESYGRTVFGVDVSEWTPGHRSTGAREPGSSQSDHRRAGDSGAALARSLDRLRACGLDVDGEVVPHDPLDVLRDVVLERGSAEVVIVTRSHALSEALRTDWTSKARRHLDVPVLHLLEHAED